MMNAICRQAIDDGLDFIYQTACEPAYFDEYGFDYLGCFYSLASTSRDQKLRRRALHFGRERALEWRRKHARVPGRAQPADIANLVLGSYAAHGLGLPDDRLKQDLRTVAANFTAADYYDFDPAAEPPPVDVPEECDCGTSNRRGRKTCRNCRRRLTMMTRYRVWQDALIRTYVGERYRVRLGAAYGEVIKWLPSMRPYPTL